MLGLHRRLNCATTCEIRDGRALRQHAPERNQAVAQASCWGRTSQWLGTTIGLEEYEQCWLALDVHAAYSLIIPINGIYIVLATAYVWHMMLSNSYPVERVEEAAETFGHVIRDDVPPVQMMCGLPIGVHAPEHKPTFGTAEATHDSKGQRPSTSRIGIVHDDIAGEASQRGVRMPLL